MPRPDPPATGAGHPTLIGASNPTPSPWLGILARSALAGGATGLVLAAAAFLAATPGAVLSALLGSGLVMVFFAISLLIGHFVGASNPSGALGLFVLTYAVKVVGFGAVLFLFGTPAWLESTWFFISALSTVITWQIAEVVAFSRIRTLLYDETAPALTPVDPAPDRQQERGRSEG
ncbi:hypothetical protein [uncultured Arthrobacter sp.]|uniref:hypothetical protein n=1 Tax=uncultured Arthrobacter sp. TaxID=114050 RepID=UPI00262C1D83|nr:hypothetical protein [uncultured Arthrobacter sp.]